MMIKSVILFLVCFFFSKLEADCSSYFPSGGSYTKTFSLLPQFVLPKQPVLLEKVSVQSREIDLSLASVFGIISFNRSGVYKIAWYGQARSPLKLPWILGFSLDNVIILGNVYGSSDPYSKLEKFQGSVVLSINAGQILCFVNASSYPIELISAVSESKSLLPSFTLCISLSDQTPSNPF